MAVTLTLSDGSVATLKENYSGYRAGSAEDSTPYIDKSYTAPSWESAFACVNALRGGVSLVGTIGGAILRTPPHACPESPNLRCLVAELAPIAERDLKNGGRPEFAFPIINCRYGMTRYEYETSAPGAIPNQFPNDDNPAEPYVYASMSIDTANETAKLPGSSYRFQTAPTLKLDVPVAVTIGTAKLVFVRKNVPYLPLELILSKQNGLNDRTMFGQPRGLIKFANATTQRDFMSDGTIAQSLTLIFQWREIDWNKTHRPDESSYDYIVDDSGRKPYTYRDLRGLLR